MTTRQLHYLITIFESGSLSAAAQILGISQPALSKFLTNYENSLGFLIFLRYHRQLTPTSVGRYILNCAQDILDKQTRMLQTIRAMTDSDHIRIRLATAPNRGAIIYSRIYNAFARKYPDISLTLTELYASDQPDAIARGKVDIAIGSGKISDKVTDLPFAKEELLVSLPASHPLASDSHIRLSDLQDTPFVLQGPRHSIRILAKELFQEAGFSPVISFESSDVILVDSMLHQAVGAGLVSQAHVFPCDELVYRSLNPPVYQTLHIRYPKGHTLTEPEQYLAGLLIRERLSDSRYEAIPSEEITTLLKYIDFDKSTDSSDSTFHNYVSNEKSTLYTPLPDVNLDTQILEYITAIVDEKSLSAAAEKYYLTQPALSRHLRNVEDMVCAQLFTRIHNRLLPTNAGKIFVNFARNILQTEMDMTRYLESYRQGHGGGIYLQYDAELSVPVKAVIQKRFHEIHPDIQLFLEENTRSSIEESLLNASADFGLYFSCKEEHPILDCRIISESRLVYCPVLSESENSVLSPHPIMVALPGYSLRTEQERLLSEKFVSSDAYHITCEASTDILKPLVEQGAAETILPEGMLSPSILSRCQSFKNTENYYLLLSHHPARNLPPSVKDLIIIINNLLGSYFPD